MTNKLILAGLALAGFATLQSSATAAAKAMLGKWHIRFSNNGSKYVLNLTSDGRSNLARTGKAWDGVWVIKDGMLTVTLWGKNLLDDDYPNYSINFGALNFITEQYGDPATYGVDFTYEF